MKKFFNLFILLLITVIMVGGNGVCVIDSPITHNGDVEAEKVIVTESYILSQDWLGPPQIDNRSTSLPTYLKYGETYNIETPQINGNPTSVRWFKETASDYNGLYDLQDMGMNGCVITARSVGAICVILEASNSYGTTQAKYLFYIKKDGVPGGSTGGGDGGSGGGNSERKDRPDGPESR